MGPLPDISKPLKYLLGLSFVGLVSIAYFSIQAIMWVSDHINIF